MEIKWLDWLAMMENDVKNLGESLSYLRS